MITAVVLAKNQENELTRCLSSLAWCQEIVVIDDNSTDDTVKIAEGLGAKVYKRDLAENFAEQRNFGLEKATQEWVLFVDADEVVPKELADEIYQQTSQFLTQANGFLIARRDIMWGKLLRFGEVGKIEFLRLARKDKGTWKGRVHETWEVQGEVKRMNDYLLHYPHPTVREFLSEVNMYSTLRAQELIEKGVKVHWWDIVLYPKAKFFLNYFFRQGFRDGMQGLVVALLMSFHSFLVRSKLWLLYQKK